MNSIINFRIGTRLAIGFAVILVLSIISTSVGIWNLRQASEQTQQMMATPLAKERIVADWYVLISSTIARTAVIARSSDNSLPKTFADVIAGSTKKGSELIKSLEPLLTSDMEKELYKTVGSLRIKYQQGRDATLKAKLEGNAAEATRAFDEEFTPHAKEYQDKVLEFLSMQRKSIDAAAKAIEQASEKSAMLMTILGVLIVAFGIVCAAIITRSITKPLNDAVDVATRVAEGDLTTDIQSTSKDEIGKLMMALKGMNDGLKNIVSEVKYGTDSIATASAEIAAGNMDLSSRTEQQAGSLEETASAMEQLTSTVKNNADNARQANQLAASASEVAMKGGSVVSEVVNTMNSINDSSKKIVDIIGVIDGIAFQTNILALNAAVEAARAGEQGRGFAVVAAEVRNLAQRSASAAKEIKQLIGDSVDKVNVGSALVGQAGTTMNDIVESVRRVTDIMAEIAAASKQQSTGIEEVNRAIGQMDQATQQNALLVEEAASAAESMQDQAASLAQIVSVFRFNDTARPAPSAIAPKPKKALGKTSLPVPAAKPQSSEPRQAKPIIGRLAEQRKTAKPVEANGGDWDEF